MKHGIICPVKFLEKFAIRSNFHLILPHLFEEFPQYKEFYKERVKQGDFVLLDNSVFELDRSFDYKKMLEYAEEIGVQEMSAPEVLRNSEATKRLRDEFLDFYIKSGSKVNILAVAQGKDLYEIYDSYYSLLKIDEIKTLGLPFDIDDGVSGVSEGIKSLTLRRVLNRWNLIDFIHVTSFSRKEELKPTHLMGLSDGIELQKASQYTWIRSNDSSSAFVHGLNLIKYTDRGLPCEKIKQKLDFRLSIELDSFQEESIHYNIDKLLEWSNNG